MKIIIATGGTGGHIFTGVAIAERLEMKGVQVVFVGSKFGMERRILKEKYPLERSLPLKFTWQKPLLGKSIKDKLVFPMFLKLSLLQSLCILIKEAPDGVIGTGGFGSFSIVFIAAILGIPTIITEIDSIPGLTTRILARFVFEVWLAFEDAKEALPVKKVKVAGCPVRKGITKTTKSINDFGFNNKKPTIFVFGGSRGAYKINEVFKKAIDLMPEFQFIWQTGESTEPIERPNLWSSKFIDDMGSAYGNADLIVSRAGALTIGELAAVGLPAILIPYLHSAGGHQLVNARMLEKEGAATVILEKELTPELLANEIKRIVRDKGLQTKMSSAIKKFNQPDAANLIANRMISLCGIKN